MQSDGAFIVRLGEQPAPAANASELTLIDFLVGTAGLTAVMVLAALALGAALGWLLIRRSRHRGIAQDHPPSIA